MLREERAPGRAVGGEATAPTAGGQGGSLQAEELALEEVWRCQRRTHLGAVRGEKYDIVISFSLEKKYCCRLLKKLYL